MKKNIGMAQENMDTAVINIFQVDGKMLQKIIKNYSLNNFSKILDVGCGKCYLLYEIKLLLPGIQIYGIDISSYAIRNAPKILKANLRKLSTR